MESKIGKIYILTDLYGKFLYNLVFIENGTQVLKTFQNNEEVLLWCDIHNIKVKK